MNEKDRVTNILSFGSLEDFAEGMKWEAEDNEDALQPATETYYAILNLAHPLGPTILMQNDKGAYLASEIVEAWSDAVTAMHEYGNDELYIVKLQVMTLVADEADHFEPCPECGMYVPKNQPCCWCEA